MRAAPATSVTIKGGAAGSALKLRATIDLNPRSVDPPIAVDPTLGDGLTVTLTDRDGVAYQVTIPAERWQLQPPLGTRWDYVDAGGILGGIRKARLKRTTKQGVVLGYSLDLRAKGADLSAVDFSGVTVQLDVMGHSTLGGSAVLTEHSGLAAGHLNEMLAWVAERTSDSAAWLHSPQEGLPRQLIEPRLGRRPRCVRRPREAA